jgi:alpha-L-fucosidase
MKKAATSDTNFNEKDRKDLTAEDIRFTRKGDVLYAFLMGVPEKQVVLAPLATTGDLHAGKVSNVELLGFPGKVKWLQDEAGLKVELPEKKPCKHAIAFEIRGAV